MPDHKSDGSEAALDNIKDGFIELEVKSQLGDRDRIIKVLQEQADVSPYSRQSLKGLLQEDWVIVRQADEMYRLPSIAKSFLDANMIAEMNDILSVVRAVNEEFVGLRVSPAEVILAGDERIQELNLRQRAWADEYVRLRLAKTGYRRGGALRQFERIWLELFPELEDLAFCKGSIHKGLLGEFTVYFPNLLFEKTCRQLIEVSFDKANFSHDYEVISEDLHKEHLLHGLIEQYQCLRFDDLEHILGMVGQSMGLAESLTGVEEIRSRLRLLVADIQEMRPFLRHNFKAEKVLHELAPGLVISWFWGDGQDVGVIPINATVEGMLVNHSMARYGPMLSLRYDGLLSNHLVPWVDTCYFGDSQVNALRATLRIVEAIHSALYGFYSKVDIDAVLARFRKRAEGASGEEPTDEEFAASCQSIVEPMEELPDGDLEFPAAFRAVRVQKLCTVLADSLGCEVRQGKGSEIVIFRCCGHHFRLGHHKRNSYVPTPVIKNLLKHVGVSFDEWLNAIA
jgi:hypothetical protein